MTSVRTYLHDISLHERTETFKKMVQHKRKGKLDMNLRRRDEKLKELNGILAEISRLEDHKKMLDMKEEMWLRGGFEEELGVIQDMKNKLDKLRKTVLDLQQQREAEKNIYHQTREQVLQLDAKYERLDREYEYVKRLSSSTIPILWKRNAFDQLPINSVKPNRITHNKETTEQAYTLTQPKGVAIIISNDERSLRQISPKSPNAGGEKISVASPSAAGVPNIPVGTPSDRVPAAITCITTLCAQLGFYIMPRHHLSSEALNLTMASMSEQYNGFACNLNSLMVIVSARSDEYGRPFGADETNHPVSITKYLKHFMHSQCPTMIGKPKIFLFLLRVTEHEPKAPVVGRPQERSKRKTITLSSTHASSSNYFQPEPIKLSEYGDDILVIRIMHQIAGGSHAVPTFGGRIFTSNDKLPWHIQILIGTMMEQACHKDFLSVLEYVKEEVALGPKARSSPAAKLEGEEDEVEIYIDHSLKKNLYLMPGI